MGGVYGGVWPTDFDGIILRSFNGLILVGYASTTSFPLFYHKVVDNESVLLE